MMFKPVSAAKAGTMFSLDAALLKVIITKGTRIKRAKTFKGSDEFDVILTEHLIPLQVF